MTIHRSGTMSRRGAHARDTGSTTGIATAVLALLSAGTLASLGLVTADGLRGGGTQRQPAARPTTTCSRPSPSW